MAHLPVGLAPMHPAGARKAAGFLPVQCPNGGSMGRPKSSSKTGNWETSPKLGQRGLEQIRFELATRILKSSMKHPMGYGYFFLREKTGVLT
jgi:hypothetical protein